MIKKLNVIGYARGGKLDSEIINEIEDYVK